MPQSLIQYLWHQSRTYSLCPATRSRTNRITPLCSPIMLPCSMWLALHFTLIYRWIGPHSLSAFCFRWTFVWHIGTLGHRIVCSATINECVKRDFHSSTHITILLKSWAWWMPFYWHIVDKRQSWIAATTKATTRRFFTTLEKNSFRYSILCGQIWI